jgi:hypothetical protein
MEFEPKSIEEHIECLARFTRKGISLGSAATPYLKALEEAFRREEGIRMSSWRTRRSLAQLNAHFTKVGQAYVKRFQNRTPTTKRRAQPTETRVRAPRSVSIPGDHRTYIARPDRDDLPLVPGPEDTQ